MKARLARHKTPWREWIELAPDQWVEAMRAKPLTRAFGQAVASGHPLSAPPVRGNGRASWTHTARTWYTLRTYSLADLETPRPKPSTC